MIDGNLVWLQEGGSKRRYRYCSDNLGSIIYLRALQGTFWKQSHWSYSTGQRVDWNWNIPLHFTTLGAHSIFILLSTMDWFQKVKIWVEDKRCSSCLLIQEMKVTKTLNVLTSLYHVSRDTCTVHGRDNKTRYFGSRLILQFGRIDILSNTIECNYSPRNISRPLYSNSWKIENWRDVVWKIIFVSSTTTKYLFETRSQLD